MLEKFKRILVVFFLCLFAGSPLLAGGQEEVVNESGIVNLEVMYGDVQSTAVNETLFDDPHVERIIEKIGIGYHMPKYTWNGFDDWGQQIRLRVAADDMPDVFQLDKVDELISDDLLADLTDLLPVYAPVTWEILGPDVWAIAASASPDGRIYFIPKAGKYHRLGAFIRKDWLDAAGLPMPTDLASYKKALEAFRDQDVDGDGDPNNEIPLTGRDGGKFLDHIFAAFGVHTWQGNPEWTLVNGELTYSAVAPEMKNAIAFLAELYDEGLLDAEVLLLNKQTWEAKIRQGSVGSWQHLPAYIGQRITAIKKEQPGVEIASLPPLSAGLPGVSGTMPLKVYIKPFFAIFDKDPERTIAALKFLEFHIDPANKDWLNKGIEGIDYTINADGNEVNVPWEELNTGYGVREINAMMDLPNRIDWIRNQGYDPDVTAMTEEVLLSAVEEAIPSDGMPTSVFQDYPDIASHKSFLEFLGKSIIGEYGPEDFDKYAADWYKSGGDIVTERAREWYSSVQANK